MPATSAAAVALLGLGFVASLALLSEPGLPVASIAAKINLAGSSKTTHSPHAVEGLLAAGSSSFLFWTLTQNSNQRYPEAQLLLRHVAAGSVHDAAQEPQTWNTSVVANETITGTIKFVLGDVYDDRSHIALIINRIVEEDSVYSSKVLSMGATDAEPIVLASFESHVPGTTSFTRIALGTDNWIVYSRRNDKRLFRMHKLSPSVTNQSATDGRVSNSFSTAGPLGCEQIESFVDGSAYYTNADTKLHPADYPGRSLSLIKLFSPKDDEDLVFSFQYTPIDNGRFFRITVSIFRHSSSGWNRHVLWQTTWHGLGEDTISADETDMLYFLTNPTVAKMSGAKTLAFVFMKAIFTLDYIGHQSDLLSSKEPVTGYACGYLLSKLPLDGLGGSAYEFNHMRLNTNASMLALSNEKNEVYMFRRHEMDGRVSSRSNAFSFWPTALDHDWIRPFLSPMHPITEQAILMWDSLNLNDLDGEPQDRLHKSPPKLTAWELDAFWSASDYSDDALTHSKIQSILPIDHGGQEFLAVAFEHAYAVVLNYTFPNESWRLVRFAERRLVLVSTLVLIVGLFALNELRPQHGPQPNRILFLTNYLLVAIIFVALAT